MLYFLYGSLVQTAPMRCLASVSRLVFSVLWTVELYRIRFYRWIVRAIYYACEVGSVYLIKILLIVHIFFVLGQMGELDPTWL